MKFTSQKITQEELAWSQSKFQNAYTMRSKSVWMVGAHHCFHLPDFLIVCLILDNQIPQLLEDGAKLDRYLFARHIPLEQKDVYVAKKEIEKDILNKTGVNRASELGLTIRSQAYTYIFLNSDIKVMRMNYISRNGWELATCERNAEARSLKSVLSEKLQLAAHYVRFL